MVLILPPSLIGKAVGTWKSLVTRDVVGTLIPQRDLCYLNLTRQSMLGKCFEL